MDRWILSKLNTLIAEADDHLANYRITEAANALAAFVDDLSNWYVRRGRERFWGKGMAGDKEAAFATLYHVLVTFSQVSAPFIPFLAEEIWQNLVVNNVPGAPESVHLCDYPTADEARIDREIEEQMDALVEVVQLGRACRNSANLKVRQPVQNLYVKGASFGKDYQALCEDELNVKEVIFTEDARAFTTYQLKPQMRTLGPKYGKLLGKIGQQLGQMDGNDVVDAFNRGEEVTFMIDDTEVRLAAADVLTEPMQKPGFSSAEDKGVTVVLDTNVPEELIREGYAREVISKVQTMRKDAGFEVTDRISLYYEADEELSAALAAYSDMISRTTLATSMQAGKAPEGAVSQQWDINGRKAELGIIKA
jgi:isoleucyl-tRNA synthetase